jgi:GNAT superfamily N-acetyltransferase
VIVRRLPWHDLGIALDLDREIFDVPADMGEHTAWWAAFDARGKPVAYGGAMLWWPDSAVYLHRAGVLPEARGHGLQRRLIRVREAWGRSQGAAIAYTYTSAGNIASSNNLIRCGYTMWAPAYWGGFTNPTRVGHDGIAWLYWQRSIK